MNTPNNKDINIKLTKGNRSQKGRRSLPKNIDERRTGKDTKYAYEFYDKRVGRLNVLNTANGWWGGSEGMLKLQKLVDAYCFYFTDDEAMAFAEIERGQLEYFQKLHPDFYGIKERSKCQVDMFAKKKLVKNVQEGDVSWSAWWLTRTQKETFSTRTETTGANGRDLYEPLSEEIKDLGEKLMATPVEPETKENEIINKQPDESTN